ncbi:MAG: DUF4350 domain-containing protein [Actinomycetaceae bacterium]|nr:DUF4350 domain-containing protein [Actinomycetaceae bacterium]
MSSGKALGRSGREWLKSSTLWIIVGAAALILLTYALWPQPPGRPLDPRSAEPAGTRALAQVLKDRGVDVTILTQPAEVSGSYAGKTLAFIGTRYLSGDDFEYIMKQARDAERVVIASANVGYFYHLGIELDEDYLFDYPASNDDTVGEGDPANDTAYERPEFSQLTDCRDIFGHTTQITNSPTIITFAADTGYRSCFSDELGGYVVAIDKTDTHPQIVVLGSDGLFTNREITSYDNAAAALTLLGSTDSLVWYYSEPSEDTIFDSTEGTVWRFLPPWAFPMSLLALVTVLAIMFWRGRRFGRLATERLPVTIKAAETTHSLGRLYERSRDLTVPFTHLQYDARQRIIRILHLPNGVSEEALINAVVYRTGREKDNVRALLTHSIIHSEKHLLTLANELATLIQEVDHG